MWRKGLTVDILPSHGTAPVLSHEKEKSLVDHIEYMCRTEYGYSRQVFLALLLIMQMQLYTQGHS